MKLSCLLSWVTLLSSQIRWKQFGNDDDDDDDGEEDGGSDQDQDHHDDDEDDDDDGGWWKNGLTQETWVSREGAA